MNTLIRHVGFEVGGESGRRILRHVKVPVSGDTIVRRIRQARPSPSISPQVIGVDDWAIKKGRTYGTIIVDLEKHCVIDLLMDRTASILSEWLQAYPDIAIIARDRSTEYAAGIQVGCPQALQVADRWHLLVNLRQMLERFLASIIYRIEPLSISPEQAHLFSSQRQAFQRTRSEQTQSQTSRERRLAQYEHIQQLRHQGCSILQISQQLGLHREAVRKNFYAISFPERKQHKPANSILDPYLPYLQERHQAGSPWP